LTLVKERKTIDLSELVSKVEYTEMNKIAQMAASLLLVVALVLISGCVSQNNPTTSGVSGSASEAAAPHKQIFEECAANFKASKWQGMTDAQLQQFASYIESGSYTDPVTLLQKSVKSATSVSKLDSAMTYLKETAALIKNGQSIDVYQQLIDTNKNCYVELANDYIGLPDGSQVQAYAEPSDLCTKLAASPNLGLLMKGKSTFECYAEKQEGKALEKMSKRYLAVIEAEILEYNQADSPVGNLLKGVLTTPTATATPTATTTATTPTAVKKWSRTFGGSGLDEGYSVQQTSDGGYVVAGYTYSYGAGEDDVYLIKTDAGGNKVWEKTFGGSSYDVGNSVQQTSDGGYVVVGTQSYGAWSADVYFIKTDAGGNKVWEKTFGGTGDYGGTSVQQTSDGGYVIAGYTTPYGAEKMDVYLIKTDASGNKVWEKTFGGSNADKGTSVQQTSDGGYVIAGDTESYGAGGDVYLIKTDASGNKVWEKTFGGSSYDVGNSVQQTSDGGYVVAGETHSYGAGSSDVYLIKTDANGNAG
jgi:hypothetical protein